MAMPISRDILNAETNARFWTTTGFRPGQKLDPKNPTDKAMMPVWMDIFRKVQAEADAGTLVTTYDHPKVAQNIADAEVANTVAAMHVDAAAKEPDPETARQHTAAASTAGQVAAQKLAEAALNQPATVSPQIQEEAAREAAQNPPPPQAPAAEQLAHAQTQTPAQNGQQMLRPEDDPWNPRYVPKSQSPREQSPAQPATAPSRATPPPEILYKEVNNRFWIRTHYKPGMKLDMQDPQDRKMAKTWMDILHEVEREANEGRLTFTNPELVPAPEGARPTPPRPMPPVVQPTPPRPMPPVVQPTPPRPTAPVVQQPMPPRPTPQQPMPPRPGMQQPGMQPWPQPGMQPMPPRPGMQPWPPPGMQPPPQRPMPPGPQRPMPPRPGMQPWPGMPQPGMQPPGMPQQPSGMQPPGMPQQPSPQQPMPGYPSDGAPPSLPTESAAPPPIEPAPEGVSKGKVALIVLGLAAAAGATYVATRPPSRTVSFRTRAKSTMGASSSAYPSSRGGRY